MTPEQWRQIDKLLESVLELDATERAAFLDNKCAGDEPLRREVESLLAAHHQAQNFLASPAWEVAAKAVAEDQVRSLVGRKLGPYEIHSLLGAGGMGEVYLARDSRLDRNVAVKVLPEYLAQNPDALSRFKREAKAAASLSHSNILAIHDFGTDEDICYAVMELLEGETLYSRLKRSALDWRKAAEIGLEIAEGLSAAHAKGIIHRDLKPENIFLTADGQVKILDFGLAKVRPAVSAQERDSASTMSLATEPGTVMGTVGYMSPEQVRGETVDAASDIFSFGCVLYEMIAGQMAFAGKTAADAMAAILKDDPPQLVDLGREIPVELDRAIRRCLEKNPTERHQSAHDLSFELRAVLEAQAHVSDKSAAQDELLSVAVEQTSIPSTRHGGEKPGLRLSGSKSRFVISAAIVFLVIAVIALAVRQTQIKRSADETPLILQATQIALWSGLNFYPSLSPDGNTVAFSSDRNGSFEIYVKQLIEGAREVQLTSDAGQNFQPAFSPDGSLIAYHSKKRGGIWIVPVTGGAAKQLTEFGSRPAFSPDGSMLAFQSYPLNDLGFGVVNALPPSTLWIVPAKGGEPKQLTQAGNPAGGHGAPSWSSDGKRIAFDAGDWNIAAVWSVSSQGDNLKKIYDDIGGATDAVYAPDGRAIFVVANN